LLEVLKGQAAPEYIAAAAALARTSADRFRIKLILLLGYLN